MGKEVKNMNKHSKGKKMPFNTWKNVKPYNLKMQAEIKEYTIPQPFRLIKAIQTWEQTMLVTMEEKQSSVFSCKIWITPWSWGASSHRNHASLHCIVHILVCFVRASTLMFCSVSLLEFVYFGFLKKNFSV